MPETLLDKEKLLANFLKLLSIPSPTFSEARILRYIKKTIPKYQDVKLLEHEDSLIVDFKAAKPLKKIALIGHMDVVPQHFKPFFAQEKNLVFGSGASDMKSGLAIFFSILCDKGLLKEIRKNYNLSFIFYAREEKTSLAENGLNALIKKFPLFFKGLDLGIVGEPTNNELQLGCLGSLHARVEVKGLACHSARPWQGENALYKALPLIRKISQIKPKRKRIFKVDFYEVMEITESECDKGITSIPELWQGNINYRFAPDKSTKQAKQHLQEIIAGLKINGLNYKIYSSSPASTVIESELFLNFIASIKTPIKAKQAWTDVAQLTSLKIPALNFGPGLTEECHKVNEHADFSLLLDYSNLLIKFLLGKN